MLTLVGGKEWNRRINYINETPTVVAEDSFDKL